MSGRVIIIGIDGATWDLLDPWIEDGDLPHIAEIRDGGAYGMLESTRPPDSIPAWPSMVTGKNPGKHGLFEFRKSPTKLHDPEPVYEHGPWQFAPDKTMAFVNVPGTYPLVKHGFNGYVVSGLFTPEDDWESFSSYTYPQSFAEELDNAVDDYAIDLWGTEEFGLLERAKKSIEARTAVFKHLLQKDDLDLFWGVYTEPDRLMHRFWAYQDEDHPLYDGLPDDDPRRDALKDHFTQIDEKIGDLLELVDDDDYIMIVSDHGFQGSYQSFDMPEFLRQHGYLSLKEDKSRSLLAKIGLHRDNIQRMFNRFGGEWLLERLSKSFRHRLRNVANKKLPSSGKNQNIKMSESQILPGTTTLTVNTEERGGPVPLDSKEAVRDAVIEDLRNFVDEHGIDGEVIPQEDFIWGSHAEEGPDIYWFFEHIGTQGTEEPGKLLTSMANISSAGEIDKLVAWHDSNGIYAAAGPDIEAVEEDASIYDVLPTLLHLLDSPIPADSDGDVFRAAKGEKEIRTKQREKSELHGVDL